MADAGVEATEKLLTARRARVRKERLEDAGQVKTALRDILADHLAPLEKSFPLGKTAPLVVMIAGVNGAGKTTSDRQSDVQGRRETVRVDHGGRRPIKKKTSKLNDK